MVRNPTSVSSILRPCCITMHNDSKEWMRRVLKSSLTVWDRGQIFLFSKRFLHTRAAVALAVYYSAKRAHKLTEILWSAWSRKYTGGMSSFHVAHCLLGPFRTSGLLGRVSVFVKYFCNCYRVSEEVCSCKTVVSIIRSIKPCFKLSIGNCLYNKVLFSHFIWFLKTWRIYTEVVNDVHGCVSVCVQLPSLLVPPTFVAIRFNPRGKQCRNPHTGTSETQGHSD